MCASAFIFEVIVEKFWGGHLILGHVQANITVQCDKMYVVALLKSFIGSVYFKLDVPCTKNMCPLNTGHFIFSLDSYRG